MYANRELVLWKKGKMIPEGFAHDWLKARLYGSYKEAAKFRIKNTLRKTNVVCEPVVWCLDAYATGGYYHWIVEVLARLWMIRDYIPQLQFAVPDYFLSKWPFVKDFLTLLNINRLLLFDDKRKYLIKHLMLPTRAGDPFYRQHEPLVEGIKWLKDAALRVASTDLGERIYISRERAAYRKVVNEADIIPVLSKHGFKVICFEDYSLPEQISICSHAKVLMGIHGAGIANMLFQPNESKVIEIRPGIEYHMYNCFHTLSVHASAKYNYMLCDFAPDKLESERRKDDYSVIIDPVDLDKNLSEILAL